MASQTGGMVQPIGLIDPTNQNEANRRSTAIAGQRPWRSRISSPIDSAAVATAPLTKSVPAKVDASPLVPLNVKASSAAGSPPIVVQADLVKLWARVVTFSSLLSRAPLVGDRRADEYYHGLLPRAYDAVPR